MGKTHSAEARLRDRPVRVLREFNPWAQFTSGVHPVIRRCRHPRGFRERNPCRSRGQPVCAFSVPTGTRRLKTAQRKPPRPCLTRFLGKTLFSLLPCRVSLERAGPLEALVSMCSAFSMSSASNFSITWDLLEDRQAREKTRAGLGTGAAAALASSQQFQRPPLDHSARGFPSPEPES